jgi:endonuclease G
MIMTIFGLTVLMLILWQGVKHSLKTVEIPHSTRPAYLPDPKDGKVYHKPGFSLSYVDHYELPEWVTYELTVDMMNQPKHVRDQDFYPDTDIEGGSGHYRDYKGSGLRRGHLVPSADMAWDKASMDATFLLSNIAPMRKELNDGIWLDLEHNVRNWSRKYKSITVVAGPVFSDPVTTIGQNEILVPRYFYKAVFTLEAGKPKVIGFLFDQMADPFNRLETYIVSIDSIEQLTGIDLFSNLYGDCDEDIELEKQFKISTGDWPIQEKRRDEEK